MIRRSSSRQGAQTPQSLLRSKSDTESEPRKTGERSKSGELDASKQRVVYKKIGKSCDKIDGTGFDSKHFTDKGN